MTVADISKEQWPQIH